MKTILLVSAGVFCIIILAAYTISPESRLLDEYQRLQIPLFSGFLTIGGFLLSLKTFILIKLKEDLYASKIYDDRAYKQYCFDTKAERYGPLRRLGNFLVYSVLSALLAAILQISLGFVQHWWAAAICFAIAGVTLILVLIAWWQIRMNLRDWFELLEQHSRAEMQKRRESEQASQATDGESAV